jgi:hypothetical protein
MPWLNSVKATDGWSRKNIDDLWSLAKATSKKIGDLNGEDIYKTSLGSSFCYIFLLKDKTPVFAVSLEKRLDILGWQEDIVAKDVSVNTVESLYQWLTLHGFHAIISSSSHSDGMRKVWMKLLSKHHWEAFDDDTGTHVNITDASKAWSTNTVIKIKMGRT